MDEMISDNDILNARIMIVDDNRTNVKLLEKMLATAGYTSVLSITDPRETEELYKSYCPDLILLDINMPHLDGYQVMEMLKKTELSNYVPILVLTALQDNDTRIRSLKCGARDFLTKPFNQIEALARIRNMLELRLLHNHIQNQNVVLEQRIQERTRDLTEANKELEEFVYIISHDLKEPLFSIAGHASRTSRDCEKTLGDKGKFYLKRIKENTKTMSRKIDEIMEVLKVGRVMYNFKYNNSNAIVANVIEKLKSTIESRKIGLSIHDNLPTLMCDEEMLKDVFLNLIGNAIKFIDDGELRQIKIECNRNGEYYKFLVEDTGIGIRKEYQKQIFKIFRKLNDIEDEGTGIGLAIVKKIVTMHKGKIWVDSPVKNGRGSRFYFTIPIERKVLDQQYTQS